MLRAVDEVKSYLEKYSQPALVTLTTFLILLK